MRGALLQILLFAVAASAQKPAAEQLFQSAVQAQQRGDFVQAVHDYREVLALHPDSVEAKVNMGAALVHLNRFEEAIAAYQSALKASADKDPIRLNLALAYFKEGDFKEACTQFDLFRKAHPEDLRSAILLADSSVRLGQADAALKLLLPLEQANSGNMDFEYVLGSALVKAGNRREGVARLEKVAKSSNSADAYLLAGSTLFDLNEFEQARGDLDAALRLNPKLPGIQTLDGKAQERLGEVEQATADFRQALQLNPDDFEANLHLGAILYKQRKLEEAKPYLEHALRLNPSSSMARYEVAMLQSASGEYEPAVRDLEELVKTDPSWLEPHVQLAALYYRLHRSSEGARERQIVDRLTAEQQAKGPGNRQ